MLCAGLRFRYTRPQNRPPSCYTNIARNTATMSNHIDDTTIYVPTCVHTCSNTGFPQGAHSNHRPLGGGLVLAVMQAHASLHLMLRLDCFADITSFIYVQWEYKATRDDELSAAAGETIIIVGEYKNPGWVWASRIGQNGQATGGYRLCPANYFLIVQQHTSPWGAATSQLPTPGLIQPSQHHNTYQQLSSSIPSAIPSQSTAAGVKGVGDGTPSTAGDSTMFGAGSRPDMTAPLSGNFVCNERIDVRRVPKYRYSMVLVTTCRVHVYGNAASDVICCHEIV